MLSLQKLERQGSFKAMESHFESLQTIEGNPWNADRFANKVTVISFTDQKGMDSSVKAGAALGKRFIDNNNFQIVTAVKVPSMFKGVASALLKGGQTKARESAVRRFEKDGKPVPQGLADRIHVVFDLNGKCSKEVLKDWKTGQAQLVLVDSTGSVQGQSTDADAEAAVDALASTIAQLLG